MAKFALNSTNTDLFDFDAEGVESKRAKFASGKYARAGGTVDGDREKDPGGQSLMASFEFVQAGNEIKIIDGDGSVYSGQLIPAEANRERRTEFYKASDGAKKLPAPKETWSTTAIGGSGGRAAGTPAQSFQVAGTNRTLNAQVIVTGQFFDEAGMVSGELKSKVATRKPQSTQTNLAPAQSFGSRISGTARIGGREIPIDARKVAP